MIIHRIADGFEKTVTQTMEEHSYDMAFCVKEQLYSGVDGEGRKLRPTYDDDPYFDQPGPWKGRSSDYKKWKESITPPEASDILHLPPRPVNVPNLFIDGTFYRSILARKSGDGIQIYTSGFRDGPVIESKYGDNIFRMGEQAVGYFNRENLIPAIEEFFQKCGYR